MSAEEREADRAKDIATQLDGARDRASLAEVERNRLALAKAVKAALWVTEARLNLAVPELLEMAQLWVGKSKERGEKWTPPKGVTDIEGLDDAKAPWASWTFDGHHWRLDAEWRALDEELHHVEGRDGRRGPGAECRQQLANGERAAIGVFRVHANCHGAAWITLCGHSSLDESTPITYSDPPRSFGSAHTRPSMQDAPGITTLMRGHVRLTLRGAAG